MPTNIQNRKPDREKKWEIPSPPFWGAKSISLSVEELFKKINRKALYRISWGAGRAKGDVWERYTQEFDGRLDEMRKSILKDPWIEPQAAYGYWRCSSEGDSILIYPNETDQIAKPIYFSFPRQAAYPFLCLSDYFAPVNHTQRDVVAVHLVTAGHRAVAHVRSLQEEGKILDAYFAHGLAVQLTSAAAEFMHQRIRYELMIGKRQGQRYSWGFPPIPDLSQQEEIVSLLRAREELRIEMTSGYQFIPEYSTAALIVHHPKAVYFRIEN